MEEIRKRRYNPRRGEAFTPIMSEIHGSVILFDMCCYSRFFCAGVGDYSEDAATVSSENKSTTTRDVTLPSARTLANITSSGHPAEHPSLPLRILDVKAQQHHTDDVATDIISALQKNPFNAPTLQDQLSVVRRGRPCPTLRIHGVEMQQQHTDQVETDIISALQKNPFKARTLQDQVSIVRRGRPCPTMDVAVSGKGRTYTRRFHFTCYKTYDWICGSQTFHKLYCWPCLLFSNSREIWVEGLSHLNGFSKSAKSHAVAENHLENVLILHSFSKIGVEEGSNATLNDVTSHNQMVKKNREILTTLIDVTVFLVKQDLPFRGPDDNSLNRGNYIETLNLLKTKESFLSDQFENEVSVTSVDIQNDLICAISDVVSEDIMAEVAKSDFVAVLMDVINTECRSQLSIVLRFFHQEKNCIQERFVGLSDITDLSKDDLLDFVFKTVKQYKLDQKLIALTYDGTAVTSLLQKNVKEVYSGVHSLLVLEVNSLFAQCLRGMTISKLFFSTLNGIATFPSNSCKRPALSEHIMRNDPNFVPTKSSFTSRLIAIVETHRETIWEFFNSIREDSSGKWSGPEKCTAHGYTEFLCSFGAVFLLNLFSPLFSKSEVLFDFSQTEKVGMTTYLDRVKDFQHFLKSERHGFRHCVDCKTKHIGRDFTESDRCDNCQYGGFQLVWEKTVSSIGIPEPSSKRSPYHLPAEQRYRLQYFSIIDNLILQMANLFSSLEPLTFFDILNPTKSATPRASGFSEYDFDNLRRLYPDIFDWTGLRNELSVIYRNPLFNGKTPHQLAEFLQTENLHVAFKQAFRLAKLILTIPVMTASVEERFAAVNRVQSYLKSFEDETDLSSLAMLSLNKELLVSPNRTEDLPQKVIAKFCSQTKRSEFIYKLNVNN